MDLLKNHGKFPVEILKMLEGFKGKLIGLHKITYMLS